MLHEVLHNAHDVHNWAKSCVTYWTKSLGELLIELKGCNIVSDTRTVLLHQIIMPLFSKDLALFKYYYSGKATIDKHKCGREIHSKNQKHMAIFPFHLLQWTRNLLLSKLYVVWQVTARSSTFLQGGSKLKPVFNPLCTTQKEGSNIDWQWCNAYFWALYLPYPVFRKIRLFQVCNIIIWLIFSWVFYLGSETYGRCHRQDWQEVLPKFNETECGLASLMFIGAALCLI